jgi:hypothetical protein
MSLFSSRLSWTSPLLAALTVMGLTGCPGNPNGIQPGTAGVPDAPVLSATLPISPADNNSPLIQGSAEASTTVKIYSTADCSGAPAATGQADANGAFSIRVEVTDDSSNSFFATATDASGATSVCSPQSLAYVEDSSFSLHLKFAGTGTGTITVNPYGKAAAQSCTQDCVLHIHKGASITLEAKPDANQTFTGWKESLCTAQDPLCAFSITDATELTATFIRPTATQVVSGFGHSCALISDGRVLCWGLNECWGAWKGYNTTNSDMQNTQPTLVVADANGPLHVTAMVAQAAEFCVISGGRVLCWGDRPATGPYYTYAINAFDPKTQVKAPLEGVALSKGFETGCALGADHIARCWGHNELGQLGNGAANTAYVDAAQPVVNVSGDPILFESVPALGAGMTCGILKAAVGQASGTVNCWGKYRVSGTVSGNPQPVLNLDGSALNATSLSVSGLSTCAITSSGALQCFGTGSDYTKLGLGDGGTMASDSPVRVISADRKTPASAVSVAIGTWQTCFVSTEGSVQCWGQNYWGNLGQGKADWIAQQIAVGITSLY